MALDSGMEKPKDDVGMLKSAMKDQAKSIRIFAEKSHRLETELNDTHRLLGKAVVLLAKHGIPFHFDDESHHDTDGQD